MSYGYQHIQTTTAVPRGWVIASLERREYVAAASVGDGTDKLDVILRYDSGLAAALLLLTSGASLTGWSGTRVVSYWSGGAATVLNQPLPAAPPPWLKNLPLLCPTTAQRQLIHAHGAATGWVIRDWKRDGAVLYRWRGESKKPVRIGPVFKDVSEVAREALAGLCAVTWTPTTDTETWHRAAAAPRTQTKGAVGPSGLTVRSVRAGTLEV